MIKRNFGMEKELQELNAIKQLDNNLRMDFCKKANTEYIVDTSKSGGEIEEMCKDIPNYSHELFCFIKEILYNNEFEKFDKKKLKKDFTAAFQEFKLWNIEEIEENPYFKNIKIPTIQEDDFSFAYQSFKRHEVFTDDNSIFIDDFMGIPHLGMIDGDMNFPGLYENGYCWMSITPNEIQTMQNAINHSKGKVCTFGLGMGYFAYMTSLKKDVESVTVVEINPTIIKLFETYLLPQFKHKEKIHIIKADALEYVKTIQNDQFDFVFVDIWQNQQDGLPLYFEMKKTSNRLSIPFEFWIEHSILEELRDMCWTYFLFSFYQTPLNDYLRNNHGFQCARNLLLTENFKSKKDIQKLLSFTELKKKVDKLR